MPDFAKRKWRLPLTAGVACLATAATVWTAGAVQRRPETAPAREVTEQEAATLHTAEQLLTARCMGRRGFSYWPVARNPVPEYREFPYVLDDLAYARRYGYGTGLEHRMRELSEAHPNKRHVRALPEPRRLAWLAALHGQGTDEQLRAALPSGGVVARSARSCTSEAERDLYEDLPEWYRVMQFTRSLTSVRRGRVVSDARFAAASARWSRCMRGEGHDHRDPAAIRRELDDPAGDRPSAYWSRLAVAEATCADRSGLGATARELDRAYERRLREEYPDQTGTMRRLRLAAVPRARAVVAGA
ncbi:hypothetical protein [Sphaerisporangium corydalis]|uniref:Secreted protein n=1 Tax=Sphaerisporangium corydalis TaxID=1441875 RepID=A0ABV9EUE8_9ACTN|nr:hypothetical protein [Sphaerisporangium corydalis]